MNGLSFMNIFFTATFLRLLAIGLPLLIAGCPVNVNGNASAEKKREATNGAVIATVGEDLIYADELRAYGLGNGNNAKLATLKDREVLLDRLITSRVVANEARRRGFEKRARVQSLMKNAAPVGTSVRERVQYQSRIDNALVQELTVEEMRRRVKLEDVSFQSVRAYYDQHPTEFKKGYRLRLASARILADSSNEQKQEILENLRTDLEALVVEKRILTAEDRASALFSKGVRYVENLSDSAQLERWATVVKDQAAKLANDGAMSPVFHDGKHFVLLLRLGSKAAEALPYEQVEIRLREQLLQDLRQKAFAEFVTKLKKEAAIQINTEALKVF